SGRAADQVRVQHQPQDREDPRLDNSARRPRHRRQGDRIKRNLLQGLLQRRAASAPMPDHLPGPMLSSNVLSPTRRTVLAGIAAGGASAVLKAAPAVARAADLPTTIAEAGTRFRSGDLTSLDLTTAYLTGIEKLEPQLNAFIAVLKEEALKTATERDAELRAGRDRGRLHGVPIVVKDLFEMR